MYKKFSILQVSTGLMEKKVEIKFSLDVDPDTVNLDNLVLIAKDSGKIPEYTFNTTRDVVELTLDQWPEANEEYLLKIQKGITSIVGDELPDSLQRNIIFKSEITSLVEVLSPADHEELSKLFVAWRETQATTLGGLVNSFYLEISTNNAFYQTVVKTEVIGKDNITISDIAPGRYYLRVRAQQGEFYGQWSEIIPFEFRPEEKSCTEVDEDMPILEQEFVMVLAPINGETPNSFIFEFDKDLDPEFLDSIIVTRRDI